MTYLKGTKTLILNQGSSDDMRESVRTYFHQTFSIEEKLYETLANDEAFYLRAYTLRHPLIFYLGHTATFYINKLNIAGIINERINPSIESMFAVGVDEMSWDDLNESNYNWPAVHEVKAYRDKIRALVDSLISSLPLDMPISWNSPWWAIIMGIEHHRIHLETSSVLIRQLPLDKVRQLDFWNICPESGTAPENELIKVKGGSLKLGKSKDNPLYGWDNEYGVYETAVQDFKAGKYLVSNREYLAFVEAGGYLESKWWTEEGWNWNQFRNLGMPLFWQKDKNGSYSLRSMASLIPMPWDWPVEVNYLEAKAFTNWLAEKTAKNLRLPTEEEWYCLHEQTVNTDQPYWEKAPGNINLEYWASACPVNKFRHGDFYDVIGNVWQWTETPIYGFPGFEVHPYYDDFSTPTFDTRHNLIKGGSFISTGNEAIRDSRYAFRRHFYQHAGFRYVESEIPVTVHEELYETDPDVVNWCEAQWPADSITQKNYYVSIKELVQPALETAGKSSALIIGCKTGRTAFELTAVFNKVTGVDFTARHIKVATHMKESGRIRFVTAEEGEITSYRERKLSDYNLESLAAKVDFWQADAGNLNPRFAGYDLILVENNLTRTYNPAGFLSMIHERLNKDGVLIIADSYDWLNSDVESSKRIGGIRRDGEPVHSLAGISEILGGNFRQLAEPVNAALYLRKDSRNYDFSLLQFSFWKKL
jgi:5-histidylcysteine sulfoxide synthase/putative 4-mercaptohistidine N1-methyltranferase